MTDFLLELRCEEIPARMQAKASDDLARLSPPASQAVNEAVEKLDQARAEFVRLAPAG